MNKLYLFKILFLITCIGIIFSSCEEETPEAKVTVTLNAEPVINEAVDPNLLEGLQVTLTDIRTSEVTTSFLSAQGVTTVDLYKGTYNITIEKLFPGETDDSDCIYSANAENISVISNGQIINLNLNVYPAIETGTGFIFSELFFNGEKNQGWMMHPDQYYVIFNPTQDTLYADGISIGTTAQPSIVDKYEFYDQYMNQDIVPLTGFVTIPGSGNEYPVLPGEKLVIAATAINHTQESLTLGDTLTIAFDHAVDLSGADFEIYPDFYKGDNDIDNPDVTNLLMTGDLYSHPRGFWAHLIFKLDNGTESTVEQFYNENSTIFVYSDGYEQLLLLLDADQILDGVVSGDARPLVTRPLPESVDRGYFQVSGCHSSELAIRKEIMVGNKIFYKDSNNSDDDFINRKGQTAYPEGWRDLK